MLQLDLFYSEDQIRIRAVEQEVEKVKKSADNVRKGIFARHNEIMKLCKDIDERLQIIERHICKS